MDAARQLVERLQNLFNEVDEMLHDKLSEEDQERLNMQLDGMDDLRDKFGEFCYIARTELVEK